MNSIKVLITIALFVLTSQIIAQENPGVFNHTFEVSEDSITVYQNAGFVYGSGPICPTVDLFNYVIEDTLIDLFLYYDVRGAWPDFSCFAQDTFKIPHETNQFRLIVTTNLIVPDGTAIDSLVMPVDSDTSYYNFPSGIANIHKASVTIHPNPTTEILHINKPTNVQIRSLQLFALSGVLLIEHDPSNYIIDVSNIPRGIYLLRIQTQSKTHIEKIVVQ